MFPLAASAVGHLRRQHRFTALYRNLAIARSTLVAMRFSPSGTCLRDNVTRRGSEAKSLHLLSKRFRVICPCVDNRLESRIECHAATVEATFMQRPCLIRGLFIASRLGNDLAEFVGSLEPEHSLGIPHGHEFSVRAGAERVQE